MARFVRKIKPIDVLVFVSFLVMWWTDVFTGWDFHPTSFILGSLFACYFIARFLINRKV